MGASLNDEFNAGRDVQDAARQAARALGHDLGCWELYGQANVKSLCVKCGAEVRVPYSVNRQEFLPHRGPAVSWGNCEEQAWRHPNRKRGTR